MRKQAGEKGNEKDTDCRREGGVREKEKEERLKEQKLEFLDCLPI